MPPSRRTSILAWLLSTSAFTRLIFLLGGPSQFDSSESVNSALLLAHGNWSCAYPPVQQIDHLSSSLALPSISPFYTVISAGIAWVLRLSGATSFPSASGWGQGCLHAMDQVANWAQTTGSLKGMLWIGLISWLFLAWGITAIFRATSRGPSIWEAVTLMAVAVSAPIYSCMESYFHPEDIVAVGLVLMSMASLIRGRWFLVGVFIGLALVTQLFSLLAVIPLILLLRSHRLRAIWGALMSTSLIVVPLAIATSGRVLHSVFFGTSRAGFAHVRGAGGTAVFSVGLHGAPLFAVSRVAPLLFAVIISWIAWVRWHHKLREPVLLTSLVGTCLALRLVFEENAFGYYYMAAIVFLLVLDGLRQRFDGRTIALIGLVTLAYSPVAWGYRWGLNVEGPFLRALLPYILSIPVVLAIVWGLIRRRNVIYLVVWQALVLIAFLRVPMREHQYKSLVPSWFWHVVLVSSLLWLLSSPLRRANPEDDRTHVDNADERRPAPIDGL